MFFFFGWMFLNDISTDALCFRNCCFETRKHNELLDAEGTNMLPFILLPLCGNEEYDMDVSFSVMALGGQQE
jgi:Domain of unknown function (DUF383)